MIDLLCPQLLQWRKDNRVALVVFEGAGDRAFCAGADIRALYRSMVEHPGGPNPYAEAFFEREYRLNYLIHTYNKTTMVWGHGVVMGAGLGIFGGSSHRIGTENSRIALPEITIGLFPDAGSSTFFKAMPPHFAHFTGLTGCQITAHDAMVVGLADHLVAHSKKEAVLTTLIEQEWGESADETSVELTRILALFKDKDEVTDHQLLRHEDAIKVLFAGCSEENFLNDFAQGLVATDSEDEWWNQAVRTFHSGCPTTAHIVVEQLKRIRNASLVQIFEMELTVAVQCSRHPDFTEGVRALLIDKDNQPAWKYEMADVPRHWIEEHFEEPWGNRKSS